MIVVSNTSPLTNLAAIGQFDLLHRLYPDVNITDGVWDELNAMENAGRAVKKSLLLAGLSAIPFEISYWSMP